MACQLFTHICGCIYYYYEMIRLFTDWDAGRRGSIGVDLASRGLTIGAYDMQNRTDQH